MARKASTKAVTLEVIATKLDIITEMVEKHITADDAKFEKVFMDNGKPSLFSRVNSLEATESKRTKHIQVLYTAIVGLAIAAAAKFLGVDPTTLGGITGGS